MPRYFWRKLFRRRKPCGCRYGERCSEDRLGYENNPGPTTNGIDYWMET